MFSTLKREFKMIFRFGMNITKIEELRNRHRLTPSLKKYMTLARKPNSLEH